MLEQLQAGKITLGDKSLGSNYGRAALSLLLQLSPYINDRTEFSGIEISAQLCLPHLTLTLLRLRIR